MNGFGERQNMGVKERFFKFSNALSLFITALWVISGNQSYLYLLTGSVFLSVFYPLSLVPQMIFLLQFVNIMTTDETRIIHIAVAPLFLISGAFSALINSRKFDVNLMSMVLVMLSTVCISFSFNLNSERGGDLVFLGEMFVYLPSMLLLSNMRVGNIDDFVNVLTAWALAILLLVLYKFLNDPLSMMFRGKRLALGEKTDPNNFGSFLAMCSVFLLGRFFVCRSKLLKVSLLFMFVVALILIILTGSRTALVAFGGGVFVSVLLFRGIKLRKKILLIIFTVVAVATSLSFAPESMLGRFSAESVYETGGTGRTIIWRRGLSGISAGSLWFGEATDRVFLGVGVKRDFAHNFFFEILFATGVVGLFCFSAFFILTTKRIVEGLREKSGYGYMILPAIMLFTYFFSGVGLNLMASHVPWYLIGLGLMFLKHYNTTTSKC